MDDVKGGEQARRPLLSAFLQSSVPDEMISDIK